MYKIKIQLEKNKLIIYVYFVNGCKKIFITVKCQFVFKIISISVVQGKGGIGIGCT